MVARDWCKVLLLLFYRPINFVFFDERAKLCVDGHHTAEILKILRKVFRCVNHRTSVDPFADRHCEKDAHNLHTASVHILGLSAQKEGYSKGPQKLWFKIGSFNQAALT